MPQSHVKRKFVLIMKMIAGSDNRRRKKEWDGSFVLLWSLMCLCKAGRERSWANAKQRN